MKTKSGLKLGGEFYRSVFKVGLPNKNWWVFRGLLGYVPGCLNPGDVQIYIFQATMKSIHY